MACEVGFVVIVHGNRFMLLFRIYRFCVRVLSGFYRFVLIITQLGLTFFELFLEDGAARISIW